MCNGFSSWLRLELSDFLRFFMVKLSCNVKVERSFLLLDCDTLEGKTYLPGNITLKA